MKDCPSLLLVEDDENDRLFIRRGLDKAGVGDRLRVACDGDEAVAYLEGRGAYGDRKENPIPALIILDLKLPKRSGLEVLAWLRGEARLKDIPVVILTSSREPRDIERARELGVLSYNVKPADLKELTDLTKSFGLLWIKFTKEVMTSGDMR
jgi:CheY-like chemotaxis protein